MTIVQGEMSMEKYVPDIYQKSIYTINYDSLLSRGIKCLLFDLDNTIVPCKDKEPNQKLKELFAKLEEDFKVIIISNSNKERLTPFKEKLNVDVAYSSRKPFKKKYKKILEIYNFKESEVACVGDQLLTDILGANRMGLTSILVNRMARYEFFPTRINRFIEHFFLKKLARENILVAGEYYD